MKDYMKDKLLEYLLVASILFVLGNELLLDKTPELFRGGNKLRDIFSNLSLAYMSSYIFYWLIIVVKERKDKKNIYVSVCRSLGTIISHAHNGVFGYLVECAGGNELSHQYHTNKITYKNITQAQLYELCEKADFKKKLDNFSRMKNDGSLSEEIAEKLKTGFFHIQLGISLPITYEKLLYFYGQETFVKEYNKIMLFIPHLETSIVRLLNQIYDYKNIEHCFNGIDPYPFIERTGDKKYIAERLFGYFQQIKALRLYYDDARKKILNDKPVIQKPVIVNR